VLSGENTGNQATRPRTIMVRNVERQPAAPRETERVERLRGREGGERRLCQLMMIA